MTEEKNYLVMMIMIKSDQEKITIQDYHAPIKTIKVKRKLMPFITDDIREMIATRNNLHRIGRQSGFLSEWNAFRQQRCKVKVALKKAETEYYNY